MARKWVFIVGCYNSGTTLLERLLRQHPEVAGLPREGQFLTGLVTPLAKGLPRLWTQDEQVFRFDPEGHEELARRAMQDWKAKLDKPEAPIALEKSPTNAARTLWLQRHFAGSAFVHIVRNGYAVAIGIRDKVRRSWGAKPRLLDMAAHQWARSAEIVLKDSAGLSRFLEVRYEDLTRDPHAITSQIFEFLNLDAQPADTFEREFMIHGLRSRIMNQNPARLRDMSQDEYECITARAKAMLEHYGYLQPWESLSSAS